jgi:hypothetical protein
MVFRVWNDGRRTLFQPSEGWAGFEIQAPPGFALAPHDEFGIVLRSDDRTVGCADALIKATHGEDGFRLLAYTLDGIWA